MKTLLTTTFTGLLMVSCASSPDLPPKYIDGFGIIHTENPPPGLVQSVQVLRSQRLPGRCTRLRDFTLSDGARDYEIKRHVAMQGGTHADVKYSGPGTFIAPYDCLGHSSVNSPLAKRVRLLKRLRIEKSKRLTARGEPAIAELPDTIDGLPIREFDPYKD